MYLQRGRVVGGTLQLCTLAKFSCWSTLKKILLKTLNQVSEGRRMAAHWKNQYLPSSAGSSMDATPWRFVEESEWQDQAEWRGWRKTKNTWSDQPVICKVTNVVNSKTCTQAEEKKKTHIAGNWAKRNTSPRNWRFAHYLLTTMMKEGKMFR